MTETTCGRPCPAYIKQEKERGQFKYLSELQQEILNEYRYQNDGWVNLAEDKIKLKEENALLQEENKRMRQALDKMANYMQKGCMENCSSFCRGYCTNQCACWFMQAARAALAAGTQEEPQQVRDCSNCGHFKNIESGSTCFDKKNNWIYRASSCEKNNYKYWQPKPAGGEVINS